MPIYEYQCQKCKKKFDMLQNINSEPLRQCIFCKGQVEKLISLSSFQFKGTGWYITDYKNKNSKTSSKTKPAAEVKSDKTEKKDNKKVEDKNVTPK